MVINNSIFQYLFVTVCSIGFLLACQPASEKKQTPSGKNVVKVSGAMKDVMWKGELEGKIKMDTLDKNGGLYGLGPLAHLKGEILIVDGKVYQTLIEKDNQMVVSENDKAAAPFFVYGYADKWSPSPLGIDVKEIRDIDDYLKKTVKDISAPFIFRLTGKIDSAMIHTQNLPEGTVVKSPQDAHQGQVNVTLSNQEVDIIGFYSEKHQGIFTHHDSYTHMHLITINKKMMGHLDQISFGSNQMTLFLPKDIQ